MYSDKPLDGPNPGHEIYFAEVVPHRSNKGEFEVKPETDTGELPFYMEEVKDAAGTLSRKPKKFYTDDYRAVKVHLQTLKFSGVTITCSRIINPWLDNKPCILTRFKKLTIVCLTHKFLCGGYHILNGVLFTPHEVDVELLADKPVKIGILHQ